MKRLFIPLAILGIAVFTLGNVKAQDCTYYYPAKKGTKMEMKNYSDKDKLLSTSQSEITDVGSNGIKVLTESFDNKNKSLGKGEFTFKCENGSFVVDMSSYFTNMNTEAYKDMEMKMDTKAMHLPANLKVGDVLDDGSATMTFSSGGMKMMSMTIKITNRKVEAIEKITTPAGTFECAKISYNFESKMMFTVSGKAIQWMAKNVGMVRTENYNSNGKLTGYSVLTSLQ